MGLSGKSGIFYKIKKDYNMGVCVESHLTGKKSCTTVVLKNAYDSLLMCFWPSLSRD